MIYSKMKYIMKRVYQYVSISKCSRDMCKCYEVLQSKNTLLVNEFTRYKECKDSRKIDDIIKNQKERFFIP